LASARAGAALLHHVALELATSKADAYVDCARSVAGDIPALAILRSELRQRVQSSALTATQSFTRRLEEAYLGLSGVVS
jgi:predicted O-linked N-acetylglucosamine transferase (SPINDLY family)